MPELKRCFEGAGFTDVTTVLSSGNVVFSSRSTSVPTLERKAEAAMAKQLDRAFYTIVRSVESLEAMLDADAFARFRLPANAKRVVTFLREPPDRKIGLPIEFDSARILASAGTEVFSAYVPGPRGPVFMALIEKNFGTNVTTRTWDTVQKCVKAAVRG